ncbi:MAG TPA: hypothetical protein VIB82_10390 [Caulobacteraceae bacterium]
MNKLVLTVCAVVAVAGGAWANGTVNGAAAGAVGGAVVAGPVGLVVGGVGGAIVGHHADKRHRGHSTRRARHRARAARR